jgi:NAD(P)-dependent dehydrogenase (short-subunit alcohol dehydrogenase family)
VSPEGPKQSNGGRSALVTGASSGIGFAIARMLLEEGYAVTAVARRPEKLEEASKRLAADGGSVFPFAANLLRDEGMVDAVAAHRARFGRLDVLVNNAGIGILADSLAVSESHLDMQINLNFRSVVVAYREALDLLEAAVDAEGTALVVNMSSITATHPDPDLPIYSAAKAAVIAYTYSMNARLGPRGIRSSALCPGAVDTPLMDVVKDSGRIPGPEMIPVDDVAEVVRMLLRLSPRSVVPEIPISRPTSDATGV